MLATNIGAVAFETDTTKIPLIDRFDVATVDTEAFVPASFTAIADQKANFQAAAAAAKNKELSNERYQRTSYAGFKPR